MSGVPRLAEAEIGPDSAREEILTLYRKHVNRGFASLAGLVGLPIGVRSSGCYVYDERGDAYLDCGGYGVFLHGHCHPVIVEAVHAQLRRHPLSTHPFLNAELALAAERLSEVTPAGLDHVTFTNSGTEAAELGLKLARINGKSHIIAMDNGFHGKTMGALSVNGRAFYKTPFEPLLPNVAFVPFGDLDAIERSLAASRGQGCVIMEPVQGEAGVIVPPDGYLARIRALCSHHDALLIMDEVQTGLGRLGAWWGVDREAVVPDILLAGKGLSGGIVPVGAVIATHAVFEAMDLDPFLHSSTFGGNPLAMSAARAAIDVIEQERLVERADALGETIRNGLAEIVHNDCGSLVADVRGRGLLIGIEFISEEIAGGFRAAASAGKYDRLPLPQFSPRGTDSSTGDHHPCAMRYALRCGGSCRDGASQGLVIETPRPRLFPFTQQRAYNIGHSECFLSFHGVSL